MALIPCPECGQSVSDKAVACPRCGHPAPHRVESTAGGDPPDPPRAAIAFPPQLPTSAPTISIRPADETPYRRVGTPPKPTPPTGRAPKGIGAVLVAVVRVFLCGAILLPWTAIVLFVVRPIIDTGVHMVIGTTDPGWRAIAPLVYGLIYCGWLWLGLRLSWRGSKRVIDFALKRLPVRRDTAATAT